MKHRVGAFLLFSAFFFSALPIYAQHGGGHGGGSTGHAMGHFGGGSSARATSSHSGGRGKGTGTHYGHGEQRPVAGAAPIHARIIQLPTPGFHMPQPNRFRRPVTEFGFGNRGAFLGFGAFSAVGLCSPIGGFPSRSFFGGDFGCFDDGFFFDPFFFGGFFPGAFGSNEFDGSAQAAEPDSVEADLAYQEREAGNVNYQTTLLNDQPAPSPKVAKPKPIILLQLTDGSMYGLTDYWVVDDRLRYVTDYGGENSVPLSRIDFEKTNQLNADRGVKFYVQATYSQH